MDAHKKKILLIGGGVVAVALLLWWWASQQQAAAATTTAGVSPNLNSPGLPTGGVPSTLAIAPTVPVSAIFSTPAPATAMTPPIPGSTASNTILPGAMTAINAWLPQTNCPALNTMVNAQVPNEINGLYTLITQYWVNGAPAIPQAVTNWWVTLGQKYNGGSCW